MRVFTLFGLCIMLAISVSFLQAQQSLEFDVKTSAYNKSDLAVLQQIIRLNRLDMEPLELGTQVWHQGRLTWFALNGEDVKISCLPEDFGNLTALTHLYLPANHLKSLPCSIGRLARLEALYLNNNALETIPSSIGSLRSLRNLYLNGNKLKEIPSCLGNLRELRNLYLNDNHLTKIPDEVANLPALRNLYF
jgi:Leucine-rich repeat (LRR) protein